MACPHAPGCPLFPYLNASLGAWRVSYCDSANGWRGCARYILSGQGRPVPLALLPNGKMPVSMLPSVTRSESFMVAHELQEGGAVRHHSPVAQDAAVDGAPGAQAVASPSPTFVPPSAAPAGRGQRTVTPAPVGEVEPDLFRAATARTAPTWTETTGTEPRPPLVDLTQQDWTPQPRPSWWRRFVAWLGGTE